MHQFVELPLRRLVCWSPLNLVVLLQCKGPAVYQSMNTYQVVKALPLVQ